MFTKLVVVVLLGVCLGQEFLVEMPTMPGTDQLERVPSDFSCKNRKFGYEFAQKLQPWKGSFPEVFYALQLDTQCGMPPPEEQQRAAHVVPIRTEPAATFFVDPKQGSDVNPATLEQPVRTLHQAVLLARQYRAKTGPATERTIVLRGGTHYLDRTLHLGAEDSYLTFQNYNGEEATMSGGKQIKPTWEKHAVGNFVVKQNFNAVFGLSSTSPGIILTKTNTAQDCENLCDKNNKCHAYTWHGKGTGKYYRDCFQRTDTNWTVVYEADHVTGVKQNVWKAHLPNFSAVPGLRISGHYVTRARYPNTNMEYDVPDNRIKGGEADWAPPKKYNNWVYINDDNEPNFFRNDSKSFQTYRVGIHGQCDHYDPPVSYWCSNETQGGGAFQYRIPSGVTPKEHVLPNAPYSTQSGQTAIFNVWRPARWANWMFEMADYDNSSNAFTFGSGGFQGARGNDHGGDFFIENVFEEMDAPNEWFWDAPNKMLYVFYNATAGTPPPTDDAHPVIVPQLKILVNHTGTIQQPVKNIAYQGVTFTATAYTYMDPHGIPSGGDWALERRGGLFFQGTEGASISKCRLHQMDGNGLMLSGYNNGTVIHQNDISWIGDSAVAAWGITDDYRHPTQGVYGTDGNFPRYTQILDNVIHEVGLYEKQSCFYIQAKTAQSTIRGNAMFNGPRAGINFNDGFGGGDEIAWNIIFNTCRESGDHGPFNSWDREPFITDVRTGSPSIYMQWRTIHHNWFIANYESQEAVDNDDGSAYYRTYSNYMALSGNGMKNDFGGHDNHHYDNVYAFVGRGFGICSQLPGHVDYFYNNSVIMTSTGNYGDWDCHIGNTMPILHDNTIYTSTGGCKMCGKDLAQWEKEGHDPGTTVQNWPSTDEIIAMGKKVLGM